MEKTKFNSNLKPYEDITLPVVWIEIGVDEFPIGLVVLLNFLFNVLPYLQIGLVCLLCLSGVSLFSIATLSHFCIPRENEDFNPKTDIRYVNYYVLCTWIYDSFMLILLYIYLWIYLNLLYKIYFAQIFGHILVSTNTKGNWKEHWNRRIKARNCVNSTLLIVTHTLQISFAYI